MSNSFHCNFSRSPPPSKTDSVMPSSSSNSQFPLANPKQEMPDPEEIQLIDDNDEADDTIAQLISGQGPKQEHDQHDFDDSNFDNTMDDTGTVAIVNLKTMR